MSGEPKIHFCMKLVSSHLWTAARLFIASEKLRQHRFRMKFFSSLSSKQKLLRLLCGSLAMLLASKDPSRRNFRVKRFDCLIFFPACTPLVIDANYWLDLEFLIKKVPLDPIRSITASIFAIRSQTFAVLMFCKFKFNLDLIKFQVF